MHHHGSAGHGGAIQGILLATLVVTAAVHLGGRFVRGTSPSTPTCSGTSS